MANKKVRPSCFERLEYAEERITLQVGDFKEFNECVDKLTKDMTHLTDETLIKYLLNIDFFDLEIKEKARSLLGPIEENKIDVLRNATKDFLCTLMSKISGRKEFKDVLESTTDYEKLLFALFPFYRDHLIHSLRVFLTGIYIFDLFHRELPSLYNTYFESDDLSSSTILKWTLASVCHDIAYPVQKFKDTNDQLEKFFTKFPGFEFARSNLYPRRSWMFAVPEFLDGMAKSPRYRRIIHARMLKSLDENKHGILGAITLLYLFSSMQLSPKCPSDYFEAIINPFVVPAGRAIALHDQDMPIEFEEFPLDFFLTLCDEIQEWGRFLTAGRIFTPFESIYQTWIKVEKENTNLEIDALILSKGENHAAIKSIDSEYDLPRHLKSKMENLNRLKSEKVGGYFYVARTAAQGEKVESELQTNVISKIPFGYKIKQKGG